MRLHIRPNAQLGFIVAVLAGVLAPMPAAAQIPLNGSFDGVFSVSLSAARFTGSGVGHATYLGRSTFDMDLVLAPSPVSPLCREIAGDLILTSPSGGELFMSMIGTICLDPNTGIISGEGLIEIVGGTGRFPTASGSGTFSLLAHLDDSGVAGTIEDFQIVGRIERP